MLKHLSARGSLFLFVRTHRHLEYYFNLDDARCAANQMGARSPLHLPRLAKVIEIRRSGQSAVSQGQ